MDFLKNVFGTGANIFGAGGNNTDSLVKRGLLQQSDVDKASNQSLMKGLLGSAVGYLAQPKNQGYGSSIPYIFKGVQQGMNAAQQPYDQLQQNAGQNMKLAKYDRELAQNERADAAQLRADEIRKLQDNLFVSTPGATTPSNAENAVINQTGADGSTQIAPNMGHLPETTTAPSTMQMDPAVLEQIKFKNPQLYAQYVGNQKTEAEVRKLKAEALAEGATTVPMAKPNAKDFTRESWATYVNTGDPTQLDPMTPEIAQKIKESKAKSTYEYGDTAPAQDYQTTVKANIAGGADKPLAIKMPYSGETSVPRMYQPSVPGKEKQKLNNERNDRTYALRQGTDSLRQERKKIRQVINSGALDRITGITGQFPSMPGGDAANAEALLKTIKEKEFLNNYLSIKKAGGGFGALSEKEGERLEQMRINLSKEQSPEQLQSLLIELDDILEREEQSLYESYATDYGTYDYKPIELSPIGGTTQELPGGSGITVTRIN